MKRTLILAAAILVLGGLPASAAQTRVAIRGSAPGTGFSPATVSIQENDTVLWTHEDPTGTDHTVTPGGSGSPGWTERVFQEPGDSHTVKFTTAGTYNYVCRFYPSTMQGTVIVAPAPAQSPSPAPSPSPPPPAPSPSPSPKPSPTASPSPASSPTPRAPSPSPSSGEVVTGSVTIDQTGKGGTPVGRIIAIVAGIVLAGSAIGLWLLRKTPA